MIQYRLTFGIFDTTAKDHVPLYEDAADLEVTKLVSIDDRRALWSLCRIIEQSLIPKGSTVLELQAATSLDVQHADHNDVPLDEPPDIRPL